MGDETKTDRPRLKIDTSEGEIVVELWPDVAPRTVENFTHLCLDGFYDGLTFFRIVPEFLIQTGCPHNTGTTGPGYTIDAEFHDRPHEPGVLSMARRVDPNSAGSQFFICLSRENCQHLDHQYTAFGKVVEGMETVERIAGTPLSYPDQGTPINAPSVYHIRTDEPPAAEVKQEDVRSSEAGPLES